MEENSKISQISNRIDKAPFGSAFVVSDFTDLAEYETVKKTLSRLEKKGMIRRVLRGVYDKPKFSTLLQEYAAPIPDQIGISFMHCSKYQEISTLTHSRFTKF